VSVPEQVTVALGELTGQMAEGLLSLAVATGLQVMSQVMEADVKALAGPRGRHDKGRTAVRHGSGPGSGPWAAAGSRSCARGCGLLTVPVSCRSRPTTCSARPSC